ncbi:MAG: GNAT family N-acetyltransferase [Bacteroidales bacterium]|nr:GNAT family N-acetyltransferase [Bacteroidales bacterium]
MIKIQKFSTKDKKLAELAFQIRQEVFVDEQNVDPELEYDEFEDVSHHYLVFENDIPVATARWRETEKGIKLERFALLKKYRKCGIGTKLLKTLLKDILPLNKTIYLHSQVSSVNLYLREGFKISGEKFMEAGIEHYFMSLK